MSKAEIKEWMFVMMMAYISTNDRSESLFYDMWRMELHAALYGLRVEGICRSS